MNPALLESAAELNEPVDPKDRFPYGWRYVQVRGEDGTETRKQVPLTLEDILHPREEDFRLLSEPHHVDCHYLFAVFSAALANVDNTQILSDCRVAWDPEGEYAHGPYVPVFFNVREKRLWSTFNVVDEETRPSPIVEVTSPSTRSTDLLNKVREYAEQRVPHFVIADAKERQDIRKLALIDYHLTDRGEYVRRPLLENGRVWLPEVVLYLGTEDGKVVCYDRDGTRRGTYVEVDQARIEAEESAADQALARAKAERVARLATRKRAEAEAKASEAEAKASEAEARASEAVNAAAAERAAREALEARLRELESFTKTAKDPS